MDKNTDTPEQTTRLHAEPRQKAPVAKLPEWMQRSIERHARESHYRDSQQTVRRDNYVTYEGSVGTV